MKKKEICLILAMSIMIGITGCGSTNVQNPTTNNANEKYSTTSTISGNNEEENNIVASGKQERYTGADEIKSFDEGTIFERNVYFYDENIYDGDDYRGQFLCYIAEFKDERLQVLNDYYYKMYEESMLRIAKDKEILAQDIATGCFENSSTYYYDHFCAPMLYEKDGIISARNNWAYSVGQNYDLYGDGTYVFNYDYKRQCIPTLAEALNVSDAEAREIVENFYGCFSDEEYENLDWFMDEQGVHVTNKNHASGGLNTLVKRWDERTAYERFVENDRLVDGYYFLTYNDFESALKNKSKIEVKDNCLMLTANIIAEEDVYKEEISLKSFKLPISSDTKYYYFFGEGDDCDEEGSEEYVEKEPDSITLEEFMSSYEKEKDSKFANIDFIIENGVAKKITLFD